MIIIWSLPIPLGDAGSEQASLKVWILFDVIVFYGSIELLQNLFCQQTAKADAIGAFVVGEIARQMKPRL